MKKATIISLAVMLTIALSCCLCTNIQGRYLC